MQQLHNCYHGNEWKSIIVTISMIISSWIYCEFWTGMVNISYTQFMNTSKCCHKEYLFFSNRKVSHHLGQLRYVQTTHSCTKLACYILVWQCNIFIEISCVRSTKPKILPIEPKKDLDLRFHYQSHSTGCFCLKHFPLIKGVMSTRLRIRYWVHIHLWTK